jgi:uncharacterized protein involved in exopolysaccharide biosynthesis
VTAPRPDEIARLAEAPRRGTLREIFAMLWRRKKWWLTPVVVVLLLIGALLLLAGGPLGPFLYPLF